MPVQQCAHDAYAFAHGEGCQNGANAQPLQMSQTEEGQCSRDSKTGDVEADLDLGIARFCDVGKLPWEQVGGDNGELAAVGDGDADADEHVADDEVQEAERQRRGENGDPQFVDIQQFAKDEAHHKAEQVRRHEFFSHDHQTEHQQPLKQIGPRAERDFGKHLGKGKGHAGDGGDAGTGVEHEHHAEAVDADGDEQRQFSPHGVESSGWAVLGFGRFHMTYLFIGWDLMFCHF